MLIGFETVIDYIKKNNIDGFDKDIYEFGVCTASGTCQILKSCTEHNIKFDKFYGFDSFEGLPDEKPGIYRPDIWKKGAFDSADHLHMPREMILPHIYKETAKYTERPVKFIKGFYADSLTPELSIENKFKPALFISMDVDIYISCIQTWEYLMSCGLIIPGTIIRYDDWGDFSHPMWMGKPEGSFGESLAHKEISDKYKLKFETMYLQHGVKIVAVV